MTTLSVRTDAPNTKVKVHFWDQMVLIGIALAVFYTIFDSILYIFLSYDVDFFRRLLGPDISVIWSRLTILALLLILGSHAQFTINQRKIAEEALRESEEKYRTIIETTEDGYYEIDTEGRMTFFNDAVCGILGYSRQELSGMSKQLPLDPEGNHRVRQAFDRVLQTGRPAKAVGWQLNRKDGLRRFVESSISLLKDTRGRITGFSGFLRDVTERKQAETLQQAKLAAEAANRAKSDFIAKMSHEIRTPLNSIIGMVELMLETELSPQQREDLDVVQSASYALLAIINNILDFSKIEAGKLDLEDTAFNPREIVEDSLRIMAMKCHAKGLELACRIDPNVPERVHGDPVRFRQVLLNLVDNAYKFTDAGEIVIRMAREENTPNGCQLHVSVTDTGVGIAREKQAAVFIAFAQAEAAKSSRYGGAGLGLAVSLQLVQLMGGRLWVESEYGHGCTFHFTGRFGFSQDLPEPVQRRAEPAFEGLKILVVDDNSTSSKFIREILESWAMKPTVVLGVEEAKQTLARGGPAAEPFGLVLVDASLPEDGGFALARWIKQHEDIHVPVVIMLTYPQLRRNVDFAELGIIGGVMKPVRPSELAEVLAAAIQVTPGQGERSSRSREDKLTRTAQPLNILVAEDTPFNQKFIQRLLERWGHEAVIVENGRQVLEKLPGAHFDLILMDVQMPEMDGYEATAAIRKAESGQDTPRHMPIVAMTAHAIKGDRERCMQAGMDYYLSKPISSKNLFDIIEKIALERRQIHSADAALKDESPERKTETIDKKMLKDAFDQDWQFFREIVDLFVIDYPRMVDGLRQALSAGDAPTFSRTAHSIKGMVRLFQAEAAGQMAQELEVKGRSGNLTDAPTQVERLTAELEHLKKVLLELSAELPDRDDR